MKIKSKSKKSLFIIIILCLAVIAGASISWWMLSKDKYQTSNTDGKYSPPTDQEQRAGDSQKEQVLEQERARNNTPEPSNQVVSVVITDAGQYGDMIEVRSFIPNHYEDGDCIITFTQGNTKIEKTTTAYRDVSTTICKNPLIKRSEFPTSGDWEVTVSYKTNTVRGVSESRIIKVE